MAVPMSAEELFVFLNIRPNPRPKDTEFLLTTMEGRAGWLEFLLLLDCPLLWLLSLCFFVLHNARGEQRRDGIAVSSDESESPSVRAHNGGCGCCLVFSHGFGDFLHNPIALPVETRSVGRPCETHFGVCPQHKFA